MTGERPPGQPLEVGISLAVLLGLIIVDSSLYGPKTLARDAADLVTMCGFGGLATAGILQRQPRFHPTVSVGAVLALIVFLAVIHGGSDNPDFLRGVIVGGAAFVSVVIALQVVTPTVPPSARVVFGYALGMEVILVLLAVLFKYGLGSIDRGAGDAASSAMWLAALMAAPLLVGMSAYTLAFRQPR